MLSSRQVGRKLSSKLRQTTAQLYSANEELNDDTLAQVETASQQIKSYQIYYVDTPGTVGEIASTIDYFTRTMQRVRNLLLSLIILYL